MWTYVQAPLNRIPLLIREDSGILTMEPGINAYSQISELDIELFLKEKSLHTIYDDDGETMDYAEGIFFEATIVVERRGPTIFVELNLETPHINPHLESSASRY